MRPCISDTVFLFGCLAQMFAVTTTSSTPALPTVVLCPRQEEEEQYKKPYQELVGGLVWIGNATRLDNSNAVPEVARRACDPNLHAALEKCTQNHPVSVGRPREGESL